MSLISEALRKARQEAAAQEAQQKGVVLPATYQRTQARSRFGVGLVLGGLVVVVAALSGAGVVWWILDQAPQPTAMAEAIPQQPATVATAIPGPIQPAPLAPLAAEPELAPDAESPAPPTASAPPPEAVVAPVQPDDPQPDPDPAEPETETEAEVAADRGGSQGSSAGQVFDQTGARVFAVEADLGDTVLSLDYLVFREEDPFAEINGTEVRVGSMLEGFVVEEIARGHVRLRDEKGPLILRVH